MLHIGFEAIKGESCGCSGLDGVQMGDTFSGSSSSNLFPLGTLPSTRLNRDDGRREVGICGAAEHEIWSDGYTCGVFEVSKVFTILGLCRFPWHLFPTILFQYLLLLMEV